MSIFVFNVASKCGLIWFAELHAKNNSLKKKQVLTLVMVIKEGWKQNRIVNSVVFCFILNTSKTRKMHVLIILIKLTIWLREHFF